MSLDGFAIECEKFFEPGALHMFSLLPARGTAVTSLVQVVRSERMRGSSRIVTGFRFSMVSAHSREEVQSFVRALAAEAEREALH